LLTQAAGPQQIAHQTVYFKVKFVYIELSQKEAVLSVNLALRAQFTPNFPPME